MVHCCALTQVDEPQAAVHTADIGIRAGHYDPSCRADVLEPGTGLLYNVTWEAYPLDFIAGFMDPEPCHAWFCQCMAWAHHSTS
jgi:hypothetical protein